jgi:RND family efflux transporter MFP subunit
VKTAKVTVESSGRRASASGVVAGRDDVYVYPRLQATVGKVLVHDQEQVRRGQPLVVLKGEQYRVAKEQALAAVKQSEAVVRAARERVAADAALKAAKDAYRKASRDLRDLIVRAPVSGTVFLDDPAAAGQPGFSRKLSPGRGASPQAPLLRIVDLAKLKFVADVDENDVAPVRVGQKALVSVDAVGGKTFSGRVSFVSLIAKSTPSGVAAFSVEAGLPSGQQGLRAGMKGTLEVLVAETRSVVRIPSEAVTQHDGKRVVFVVTDGVARMRAVTLGRSTSRTYVVETGLHPGDIVAASGLDRLKNGTRVRELPQR